MTLSKHTSFLRMGTLLALISLGSFIFFSWKIMPFYPGLSEAASYSGSVIFTNVSTFPYISYITALASIVFSLLLQILIYYFFEKTQSIEIRFLSIFVFSLLFEGMRIILPIAQAFNLPSFYINIAARALLFGRLFGVFGIFGASLFVCGLKNQREETVLLPIIFIAALISMRVTIDYLSWDTSLAPHYGYHIMFKLLELLIVLISCANFFVGAWTRNTKEYRLIGIGVFVAFLGRNLLINANLILPACIGFTLLCAGTWFAGMQLRRMYLWL
ncbi:MAG: hypothetical protein Ta2B_19850 [Termitinemataceae bacterium]|nr:MAG: hypothetical protein Ta2B_19850 [Termitinemataceae bacterium]